VSIYYNGTKIFYKLKCVNCHFFAFSLGGPSSLLSLLYFLVSLLILLRPILALVRVDLMVFIGSLASVSINRSSTWLTLALMLK